MSEFINNLDATKFRLTNAKWNDLRLNDPWSVGYVSTLIESIVFSSKEDWENFYYNSGTERNQVLSQHTQETQNKLNDFMLKYNNPSEIERLDWSLKNLNFQYGRTQDQLSHKGEILHREINSVNISVNECIEAVRFRTICETWNGIIIRERNTINVLNDSLQDSEFKKVDGSFDHKYAVDYELFIESNLICGIQIKPESYTRNVSYINKARTANRNKNQLYKNDFAKNVYDVIARTDGTIINPGVIDSINTEINQYKNSKE